jgi:hypothetical protein
MNYWYFLQIFFVGVLISHQILFYCVGTKTKTSVFIYACIRAFITMLMLTLFYNNGIALLVLLTTNLLLDIIFIDISINPALVMIELAIFQMLYAGKSTYIIDRYVFLIYVLSIVYIFAYYKNVSIDFYKKLLFLESKCEVKSDSNTNEMR